MTAYTETHGPSAPPPALSIYDIATSLESMNIVGFAGGGGSSRGYTLAGARVHAALNHNQAAMAMHFRNHADTAHEIEDIRRVDISRMVGCRRLRSAWFSPDCRDFSKAKGGKPRSKQIRGLAWVIIDWINKLGPFAPEVIFLENVEEFQEWCPLLPDGTRSDWRVGWFFRCFVGAMRRRGYVVEWREQRACDYGAPTIRKRLFLVARRDGQSIVWPEPTHGPGRANPYRTAAECIDRGRPCPSIFMTRRQAKRYRRLTGIQVRRPLQGASLRRIAVGVGRHVIHAKRPHYAFMTEHSNASGQRNMPIDEPLRTQCANVKGGHFALVTAFLAQNNGGEIGHQSFGHPLDVPVSTISAKGSQQSLVIASLVKYYGADQDPQIGDPLHSITTLDRFGLIYSELVAPPLTPELAKKARRVARYLRKHGVEFEGEFATVGGFVIVDIGMRMLTPRELYRAQGFPEDYVIDRGWFIQKDGTVVERHLTGKEQVKMCGNSVSPIHAAALIRANLPELQEAS